MNLLRGFAALVLASAPLGCGFPDYGFEQHTTSIGATGTGATGGTSMGGTGGAAGGTGGTGGKAGCDGDADCQQAPGGPVCDTASGLCVPCTPADDACPQGQYCTPSMQCKPGCTDDADCSVAGGSLNCNVAAHTCTGCLADDTCPPGTICDVPDATCVAGCTPEHACQAGTSCCGGTCADLQTDEQSCGGCGSVCDPPGGVGKCEGGLCQLAMCKQGFGDCDANPANGCETDVLSDKLNCGACEAACAAPSNATAACSGGQCVVGDCLAGFGNCDGSAANGCETNTQQSVQSCGGCNLPCSPPSAAGACASGMCAVAACSGGFADCDGAPANGCEINTQNDLSNCGGCSSPCSLPSAIAKCAGGACAVDHCAPPFGDCDATASNGCETNTNTSVTSCGACGVSCSLPNAVAACSNGGCVVQSCLSVFVDCDGDPQNGCETNLQTSASHCGACGNACSNNHGTPSCADGTCGIACDSGFANCDGSAANGCEVNTSSNVANCGSCGNACPPQGGAPACVNGGCTVSSCLAGKGDCDGNAANGCETTVTNDPQNCGGCGLTCFVANGAAGCGAGTCVIASCNAGFADCNGSYADGCETNLKTLASCGGCGALCDLPNAVESCASGSCQVVSCSGTFADCDGIAGNGCEVDTATSVASCGTCGNACSAVNGAASCDSGACSITCAAGFGNCDADVQNGCEAATTNNAGACGGCGNVCSVQNGTPACVGVTCAVQACTAPFADCDGQYGNGCEANLQTSLTTCGACGTSCTNAHGTTSCQSGACVPLCAAGFGNCDANPANGCETSTSSSPSDCGACGNVCSFANAAGVCQAGTCVLGACNPGFGNCDGSAANGCETPLNTISSCGACGTQCTNAHGGTACSGGACSPSCSTGFASCDGDPTNGCETSTTTLTNCGACGVPCDFVNATESCASGTCAFGACDGGFASCDGDLGNGCETNTQTSLLHCGACGSPCPAGKICTAGTCQDACAVGTADCDMSAMNGCEINTTSDGQHCGSCAATCTVSQYCSASSCAACGAGQRDCDHAGVNGCEVTIATDASNCGACGVVCGGSVNATGACSGGTCGIACNPGFANCDGGAANGCECSGNLCCGGACEPAHFNGLGQSFDDCAPLGVPGDPSSYSKTLAIEARAAWPFAGADADCTCTGQAQCVYRKTATSCALWVYTKNTAGHVAVNLASNACFCATINDPVWQ